MHSFLCFSKIGFLHDIDLYLGSLSLENCDFDSKQLSLPVAISGCRAAPMGANPLGHTFKPLTLYDISIYTIYFSHPHIEYIGVRQVQTFFRKINRMSLHSIRDHFVPNRCRLVRLKHDCMRCCNKRFQAMLAIIPLFATLLSYK